MMFPWWLPIFTWFAAWIGGFLVGFCMGYEKKTAHLMWLYLFWGGAIALIGFGAIELLW